MCIIKNPYFLPIYKVITAAAHFHSIIMMANQKVNILLLNYICDTIYRGFDESYILSQSCPKAFLRHSHHKKALKPCAFHMRWPQGFFIKCNHRKIILPVKGLQNLADPSFRRLYCAHLDAGQGIVQFLGHRPHLGHAAGKADLLAMIHDLAYRGDNGCRTAQAALSKLGKLR